MPKLHLLFLIHGHQPVGNFDDVFERVYQQSYLPFVETLARHPAIHMALHYSGPLLEWFEVRHPEFFDRLRQLIQRRQVELLGGGFYEPILVSIPAWDQAEQIRRMREYLADKLGQAPTGAWLTERVWEPQLPSILASSDVQYTLVDDLHFLAAGFDFDQLFGDYVVEDAGHTVRVIPGLKQLRYLLPFRPVNEALDFLRQSAAQHPGGMAATGDDCEKFGAWPGTYDLCYVQGWLEDFFTGLENSSEWLDTVLPSDYLAGHAALGRADLPTASYSEMMEWALPTPAHKIFECLTKEFEERPEVTRFLRGAPWRAFFTKYAESNLLHKKMLRASEEVHRLAARRSGHAAGGKVASAQTHVLRAQCNDAYWHGIFGGLYAPHLRTALWAELVRAEALLQEASAPRADSLRIERCDYDADGQDEILIAARRMSALLRPADGGTLAMLDFPPRSTTLINSLQRRPEAYHERLRQTTVGAAQTAVSIHEIVRSKEPDLDKFLLYDRWPRNAFRLFLFRPDKKFEDYQALQLGEEENLAGGLFGVRGVDGEAVVLSRDVPWPFAETKDSVAGSPEVLCCTKKFHFTQSKAACQVSCEIELVTAKTRPGPVQVGLEVVLNFLAPDAPTRYFETVSGRHPLNWAAALPASSQGLRIVDEWQGVAATLKAPAAAQFWIAPIETISESEDGFERVYQGSQILVIWSVDLASSAGWRGQCTLDVEAIDSLAAQSAAKPE